MRMHMHIHMYLRPICMLYLVYNLDGNNYYRQEQNHTETKV